ncbi:hypothetical protein [Bhargavaea cecembensis]|uniref:hypothetical protein n=1 Tax=Bhargavaea cecembensis TaxID=394098 RepID=UPI00058D3134|nr:hypothetical protein [Bhargavaea cecembensis]
MIMFPLLIALIILLLAGVRYRRKIPVPGGRLVNRLFLVYMAVALVGAAIALVVLPGEKAYPYVGDTEEPLGAYETVIDQGNPDAVPPEQIASEHTFSFSGDTLILQTPFGRGYDGYASVAVQRGEPGEISVVTYQSRLLLDGYDFSSETGPKPPVFDSETGRLTLVDYETFDVSRITLSFLAVPFVPEHSNGWSTASGSPVYLLTVPEGVDVKAEGPMEIHHL